MAIPPPLEGPEKDLTITAGRSQLAAFWFVTLVAKPNFSEEHDVEVIFNQIISDSISLIGRSYGLSVKEAHSQAMSGQYLCMVG